jgi:hypothetical protein
MEASPAKIFRAAALERLSSPEQLDQLLACLRDSAGIEMPIGRRLGRTADARARTLSRLLAATSDGWTAQWPTPINNMMRSCSALRRDLITC